MKTEQRILLGFSATLTSKELPVRQSVLSNLQTEHHGTMNMFLIIGTACLTSMVV